MSASANLNTDKTVVDRSTARSATKNTVRGLRDKLTSRIAEPVAYEYELTENFARSHVNSAWAMPVLAAITALVSNAWIGPSVAGIWFVATLLSYILLTRLSARFLRESENAGNQKNWQNIFFLSQLLLAVCWSFYAATGILVVQDSSFTIIQFSILLVVQAVTTMLTYSLRQSVLIICVPPTAILALQFMFPYDAGMMIMAAVLMTSILFFFFLAGRFKISVLTVLQHKEENKTLIAELETARAISEEARRRAEEANLAKSRFLATMSHELRTPLNAILGFSEVIMNEVLGPLNNDTYKEYVGDIHSSGDHLLKVINEILDLSRIEAGRQDLTETAVYLTHVVDDARNMTQLKAKTKGITITVSAEKDLPQLWADERAVRQITLNLLSNAVKFTPTGGDIVIKVGWTSTGGQYLSVKDNGPGIAEEEIPVVLSSFGQGSIAIKSAEQGSGLGLPIVQALMHMHEGRFELKSKLREGTETIATFPRHRVLEVMRPVQEQAPRKLRGQRQAPRRSRVG